jgi:S-DNA-T family DNA segregation ATPase FtsK/SpoIIIE
MAKKKKRKAKQIQVEREPNMFLRGVWAVLLIVIALFMLIGGFGMGGALPTSMFKGAYAAFGIGAYLVPVALVFWSIHKFKHEEHKIPFMKIVSMLIFLVLTSSWLHVGFVSGTTDAFGATTWAGGHGGAVGKAVGGAGLAVFSNILASIIFFLLDILVFCWVFGLTHQAWELLKSIFRRRERSDDEDTDLGALKQRAGEHEFQMNEGVPVVHHKPGVSIMKNSAPKQLSKDENHKALTTTNDPDWQFPGINLLNQKQDKADAGNVAGNADIIRETFENFNYEVEMEGANIGPRVTQYTLKPPAGVKLSKIAALDDNLAYSLAAQSIRIEAPIPGKKAVGIEVPNVKAATVRVSSLFESEPWKGMQSNLGFVIGRDISGAPVVASIEKMPHLLIAGQTASGKSVMVNTLLTSLLYRNSPSDLKLILVDPKHVELNLYEDIPHLLTPVITEPEKCISALKWAVAEMERRYRALAAAKKRNIADYNEGNTEGNMPYIVIVIDELADLMMMAARDVEALVVRIAQKARAVGIHLVLATQRPSVDVVTGLIKANVPARIAFTVASQIDSRTIIDMPGAEKLLGMGDMLFATADMPKPKRVQGALITSEETQKVTDFLRMQRPPQYDDEVVSQPVQLNGKGGIVADYGGGGEDSADDQMWQDAVRVVIENRKASTSLLQRRLRIGYGRASRLIDQMEEQGIVGGASGAKPRDVLVRSMDEVFGGGGGDDESGDEHNSGNTHPFDDVIR